MKTRNAPQRLVGEVQMFRIRVAAAESKLKVMREQAREAKRRRKEAKRNAQLVRRRFKQSKADLSELREALAKAEAKLFQAGGRELARKTSQAKRTAQTQARKLVTAKATPPSRRSPAATVVCRKPLRKVVKRKTGGGATTKTAKRLDPAPITATENQALSSLESTTPGEPVSNATTEPL